MELKFCWLHDLGPLPTTVCGARRSLGRCMHFILFFISLFFVDWFHCHRARRLIRLSVLLKMLLFQLLPCQLLPLPQLEAQPALILLCIIFYICVHCFQPSPVTVFVRLSLFLHHLQCWVPDLVGKSVVELSLLPWRPQKLPKMSLSAFVLMPLLSSWFQLT